ncbi:hypothetical protein [Agromyces soli]|uniref:hypothetical protein n=1 Tax=Agromyces soli TaxID=659012 RepID=UPI0031E0C8A8
MDPYSPLPGPAPQSPPPTRARGVGGGVIAASAGGAAALFLVLLVPVSFAAVHLGQQFAVVVDGQADGSAAAASELVDRLQSGETRYTFPAALENYGDGRYSGLCPAEYAEGCWQSAVFTESDCATVSVVLWFSNDPEGYEPEQTATIELHDVVPYEAAPVVFGNDGFEYGWVADVLCPVAES